MQSKPKSKLNIEFNSLNEADAFGESFDTQTPVFLGQISFDLLEKRSISEFDHLRFLF